jgi:two-component system chemotaxis sensor kinase CheA
MAIPLSEVARLEEFPARAIERSNGQALVQYRGEIMPLVTLGAPAADDAERTTRQVVVLRRGDRHVGLLVDRIVDIITERIVVERPLMRPGVLGSAIVQQRVTELLEVKALLAAVEPRRLQEAA